MGIFTLQRNVLTRVMLFAAPLFIIASGGCGGGSSVATNPAPDDVPADAAAGITVDGPDYSIGGSVINIAGGGEYVVSGAMLDGGVVVDAPGEVVNVVLSGATIRNSNGPAILAKAASSVRITLSDGAVNVLSDGGADEDHDAAIFSSVPLVLDGDGALDVTGNNQEGIASDSTLTVNGGNIRVAAVDDGLNSGEGIVINGGYIYIDSVGDGIDSNAALTINGGTIISLGGKMDDGLDADEAVLLNGGTIIATGANNSTPDASSSQKYILLSFGDVQAPGTMVHIEENDGTEIVTFKPAKEYEGFLFSSDALRSGVVYSVYSGGEYDGSERDDGLCAGGTYSGGTRLSHFNSGSADEDFIISGTGGVFSLGEGQQAPVSPGGALPPADGGLPPGHAGDPGGPQPLVSGDMPQVGQRP
ncbi:MAG: carbohydrate-binding domain-containing protein [Synergistaceae bacterium]|nr:carbohydrate-binding domain-containing protein [Synergistaceae bacterium]